MDDQFVSRVYPEPHEGIIGDQRYGDPLLTSDLAWTVIPGLVRQLYSTALMAFNAPKGRRLYERMTSPQPGDRVVVADAVWKDETSRRRGVGYLITVREEWWTTNAEWERLKAEDGTLTDDDRMVEPTAWYVQYGPDPVDVYRWVNCTVLALTEEDRG